ncbi:MAG: hypothetical protein LQ340_003447 [Diploschistes diacapsis]|nr:MAG: hypothetical protein LQ340_003447 [Diploschistes diacapsis]
MNVENALLAPVGIISAGMYTHVSEVWILGFGSSFFDQVFLEPPPKPWTKTKSPEAFPTGWKTVVRPGGPLVA